MQLDRNGHSYYPINVVWRHKSVFDMWSDIDLVTDSTGTLPDLLQMRSHMLTTKYISPFLMWLLTSFSGGVHIELAQVPNNVVLKRSIANFESLFTALPTTIGLPQFTFLLI